MAVTDMAASVLGRLKNQAKETGLSYQECLQLFAQEELLRRLSQSKYRGSFVLKGGLFIYTATGFASRATRDVDLLARGVTSTPDVLSLVFAEIIETPSKNDYLSFEVYKAENITEQSEYSGVRLYIRGRIRNIRIPFSVDIGVGDVIVPKAAERELPTRLSGFQPVFVLTYSLESTISEKFDAILRRMEATSRMKDFYDISYLAALYDFDGAILREAIWQTLQRRGTPYEADAIERIKAFSRNDAMLRLWKGYLNSQPSAGADFPAVIDRVVQFLSPVYQAILREEDFSHCWLHTSFSWNKNLI